MYVAWVGASKQWVIWRAFDYCVENVGTPSDPLSGMHLLGVGNLSAVFRDLRSDLRSSETLTRQNLRVSLSLRVYDNPFAVVGLLCGFAIARAIQIPNTHSK